MNTKITANWRDFVAYGEERPNPQTMIENERARVIVAGLKPGQQIPLHPEAAAVYHFLEGQGVMMVDGEKIPVQEGAVIFVNDGSQRGMVAETQLVFLAVRIA